MLDAQMHDEENHLIIFKNKISLKSKVGDRMYYFSLKNGISHKGRVYYVMPRCFVVIRPY
jgi:hypothetical protein